MCTWPRAPEFVLRREAAWETAVALDKSGAANMKPAIASAVPLSWPV